MVLTENPPVFFRKHCRHASSTSSRPRGSATVASTDTDSVSDMSWSNIGDSVGSPLVCVLASHIVYITIPRTGVAQHSSSAEKNIFRVQDLYNNKLNII